MTRKNPAAIVLILMTATLLFATPIAPADKAATVDGVISPGEYPIIEKLNGIEFGASLSKDGILTLAIRAPTEGWVAIGLGSGIMDGSWMLLAYDKAGVPAYSEQLGISHFHQPVKQTKILAKSVRAEGGYTTLEFQIKASEFEKGGKLPVIMAFGKAANFTSYHERHAQTVLTF